jgi:hypothetical protein
MNFAEAQVKLRKNVAFAGTYGKVIPLAGVHVQPGNSFLQVALL